LQKTIGNPGAGMAMTDAEKKYLGQLTEAIYLILSGWPAAPVPVGEDCPGPELKRAMELFNRFVTGYGELNTVLSSIAQGNLDIELPQNNEMAALQLLGSLQASFQHLTWKTQRIAGGDFTQQADFMGDFSKAFNRMTLQLKNAFQKIEQQNQQLQKIYDEMKQEKERADRLLKNLFPARVVNDLKTTGQSIPETFENVTVLFSDIVGFTNLSSGLEPKVLIDELNELFTAFDIIIEDNHCERIKTIGDAYLAVSGMNEGREYPAGNMVGAALQIMSYLEQRNARSPHQWQVRVGIHTGKIVGGVVGIRKYIYDVFGDTINTACRMEQSSEPMKINLSEVTAELVKDKYELTERGEMDVKGKGKMKMYFASNRKPLADEVKPLTLHFRTPSP